MCCTMFKLLGMQKRSALNVWGLMAPMGKLTICLGLLGRQNCSKGHEGFAFEVTIS